MTISVVETLSNRSATLTLDPSCNDLHSCRTIWNIICSSLFTLFACVWLSVHPNIPAPDDSWGKKATRRVFIMMMVLLAPEFLVGWAMRQWLLATEIADKNQEYEWTKTHGFFAVMGGFMECDKDGRPIRTVTLDKVDNIPVKNKMAIREDEIMDKSKGDILSKTFAILQTSWFILQCISRTVQGLPVTELEIATVAFCALNIVTYILWWNKPLSVSRPVRIYADEGTEERGLEEKRQTWRTAFKRGLADIPREVYRSVTALMDEGGDGAFVNIVLFPFYLAVFLLEGDSFDSDPRRVGTFSPRYSSTIKHIIMSAVVGTVFGAIHCTAWNSQFPSHTEQLLWRVAAVSVTTIPLFVALFIRGDSQAARLDLTTFAIVAGGFLYLLARFTLLVLPLMSLRSLPPGAFVSVNWIRFIPHI